jgi:hypothetical protein
MDLLGFFFTSGHRIAVIIFRSSKLERNGMANISNCRISLNDPACHPFISILAMKGSYVFCLGTVIPYYRPTIRQSDSVSCHGIAVLECKR